MSVKHDDDRKRKKKRKKIYTKTFAYLFKYTTTKRIITAASAIVAEVIPAIKLTSLTVSLCLLVPTIPVIR